ncbi:dual specificity mitogen-activated protein kinase kinase hemipterous-like isoform X2 [Phlebotomus argentipes]|uniref:dual specificity mitogen-activated protein kinase kinase hemipterous-like isoform X2 n=1 Tax=Phlebotomus argentipes TaxID=94469 RepID=UPI0028937FA7|nr:dual specificity mitogen-activated protein kinase kinase hemipterous-like isoform X2 [Phlebotomus argentipes]
MSNDIGKIGSKIQILEDRLSGKNESGESMDKQPFDKSRPGSGRRPDNLGEFGRGRKPGGLDLPVGGFQILHSRIEPETENKLKTIMKRSGILCIDGKEYKTDIKDLEDKGELGNGTSGQVVKMRHVESDTIIAVKQMRRTGNEEENKRIIMDLDVVLKSHDCPFIVRCLGCFITQTDVWICMELMATCFDKLQKKSNLPVPEDILGKVTVATVKALAYLKDKHGVIHRDVKPSNILIDEKGVIKLCDFGISGRLVDSKAKTRSAGCAAYMAPERIDPKKPEYDIRADVWSLGITLVELATGSFPYKGCKTDFEVLTKVLESDPPSLPTDQGFSVDFQDFVIKCLTKNSHRRPKYPELLRQPFLKYYEDHYVDVPSWFSSVMEKTGLKSHRRLSSSHLQSEAHRTIVAPSSIPNYHESSSSSSHRHQVSPSPISPPSKPPAASSCAADNGGCTSVERDVEEHRKLEDLYSGGEPSGNFTVDEGDFNLPRNAQDNYNVVSEMNKMYRSSPFMQRRREIGDFGSPRKESMMGSLGHTFIRNMTTTPFAQKKISNQARQHQLEAMRNQTRPPDGDENGFGNLYIPDSPLPLRKSSALAQEHGQMRLPGNTSPIVLQRFYHQQSQLRERQLEEEVKLHQENTNPFHSDILKYQTIQRSHVPNVGVMNPFHEHQYHQYNHRGIDKSHAPHADSQKQHQYLFNSCSNGKKNSVQPSSLGFYPTGDFRAEAEDFRPDHNVYSNSPRGRNSPSGLINGLGSCDGIKDDTGVVKRRFASYMKLHLASGERGEKSRGRPTVNSNPSTVYNTPTHTSNNPFLVQERAPIPIQPPSPHILSGVDRRHRSPDPPPRYNRGQSPLLLRRNLYELGQVPPGSPIMPRRYLSSSPPVPPPRRGSESVPGSPQHFRTRIHYTPEPQRRFYRHIDQ